MATLTVDTSKLSFPDLMDLRTAAMFLNVSEMRIRTLARTKVLVATKDPESKKWVFKKTDLEAWKNTPHVRGVSTGPRGEGKA